jgi:hypothetical protein
MNACLISFRPDRFLAMAVTPFFVCLALKLRQKVTGKYSYWIWE